MAPLSRSHDIQLEWSLGKAISEATDDIGLFGGATATLIGGM